MKRILLVFIVAIITLSLKAQQHQQYTQYMVNPYTINPAVGGTEDYTDVKVGYRTQWMNFGRDNSGPRTMYITAHTALGKPAFRQYHRKGEHGYWHGVGGYIYTDKAGPITNSSFLANYSFNMALTRKMRLSVGAFAGVKQFKVDQNWWNFTGRTGYQDDYLTSTNLNRIIPDFSFGMWLYTSNYYIGASIFQLLGSKIDVPDGLTAQGDQGTGKLNNHYFITGGIRLPMSENIDLVPSMALKGVVNTPLSVDLNIKAQFRDIWFAGINWRVQDSFAGIVGVVIMSQIEVSYSYDFTTTKEIRTNSSGTHEVILGLRIPHAKNIQCPSKFW